jgi:hypothetical protein
MRWAAPRSTASPPAFLDWLQTLLVRRGVPPQALIAGLEALRPVIEAVDTGAALLLDLGRQGLLDGLR